MIYIGTVWVLRPADIREETDNTPRVELWTRDVFRRTADSEALFKHGVSSDLRQMGVDGTLVFGPISLSKNQIDQPREERRK